LPKPLLTAQDYALVGPTRDHSSQGSSDSKSLQLPIQGHWSISPLVLLLLLPIPMFILSCLESPSAFINWGQPYLLNSTFILYAASNLAIVAFVFLVGFFTKKPTTHLYFTENQISRLVKATNLVTFITFAAYAAWIIIGVSRGLSFGLLRDALSGSNGAIWNLKTTVLEPVSGVTSWTQLGVILGPLLILKTRLTGKNQTRLFISLLVVTLLRAIFFSERLALVEVIVATSVAYIFTAPKLPNFLLKPWKFLAVWLSAAAGYVTFFAATEFIRSWTFYSVVTQKNIFEFSYDRIIAYYATALNNGALYIRTNGLSWDPFALLQGNFGIAGLQEFIVSSSQGSASRFTNALWSSSDPEFSNVSGIFITTSSLGILGSWLFWLLIAAAIIAVFRMSTAGSLTAIVLYSVTAVGILELDRLFYFGQSRIIPELIAILLLSFYLAAPQNKFK